MLRKIYIKLNLLCEKLTVIFDQMEIPIPLEEDEYLTVNETASLLKVSHRTIRRWQAYGIITPTYIGGTVHFSKVALKKSVSMNKLNRK